MARALYVCEYQRFVRKDDLHELPEHLDDLVLLGVTRVAGAAGVRKGVVCELGEVLFLHLVELLGDSDVIGQLLYGVDSGLLCILCGKSINIGNAHGAGNFAEAVAYGVTVIVHDDGKEHGTGNTVRGVIVSGQGVGHGVVNAETYV